MKTTIFYQLLLFEKSQVRVGFRATPGPNHLNKINRFDFSVNPPGFDLIKFLKLLLLFFGLLNPFYVEFRPRKSFSKVLENSFLKNGTNFIRIPVYIRAYCLYKFLTYFTNDNQVHNQNMIPTKIVITNSRKKIRKMTIFFSSKIQRMKDIEYLRL